LIGLLLRATALVAILSGLPALTTITASAQVTHVTWLRNGVLSWNAVELRDSAPPLIHRLSFSLAPGSSRVIAAGTPGIRKILVRYTQRDGGPVKRSVIASSLLRAPKPKIIAQGVRRSALAGFEAYGIARLAYIARGAMEMLATGYSADCNGCDGMTAIGRRAGHGIVAVDPHVIPLGTHLFIPGYGLAVAGDTGGAIVGHRIDLGFDSLRDAMLFGRHAVTVYRLK
jgi:3D (Asp-Asp-Asp) domain-containing protein